VPNPLPIREEVNDGRCSRIGPAKIKVCWAVPFFVGKKVLMAAYEGKHQHLIEKRNSLAAAALHKLRPLPQEVIASRSCDSHNADIHVDPLVEQPTDGALKCRGVEKRADIVKKLRSASKSRL
jgi:hypothetical protein